MLQGADIAANRLRECSNAIAKTAADLKSTPARASTDTLEPVKELYAAVTAESVRLELVAACWRGETLATSNAISALHLEGMCQSMIIGLNTLQKTDCMPHRQRTHKEPSSVCCR